MAKLQPPATAGPPSNLAGVGGPVTGTILFCALSVLSGGVNTVSSDLESLLYVLVQVASGGKLPGRHALSPKQVEAYKFVSFVRSFESDVLRECKAELQPLVRDLAHLFSGGGIYRTDVTCRQFLEACGKHMRPASGPASRSNKLDTQARMTARMTVSTVCSLPVVCNPFTVL